MPPPPQALLTKVDDMPTKLKLHPPLRLHYIVSVSKDFIGYLHERYGIQGEDDM